SPAGGSPPSARAGQTSPTTRTPSTSRVANPACSRSPANSRTVTFTIARLEVVSLPGRRRSWHPRQMATDAERQKPASRRPPGWRAEGADERPRRSLPRFPRALPYILFVLALLGLNYWLASRATQGPARPRVPYSPFFLREVRDSNVQQITSKGTA